MVSLPVSGPLLDAMSPVLRRAPAGPLVVAFSGGGDSTALLALTRAWAVPRGVPVLAVTVDHGLRSESADEAARAGAFCARLRIPHTVLRWTGWDGTGNPQDAARRARRRLIGGFARARGAGAVLLGHTMEDQAETFLMRLSRGSGVDGLSAMDEEIAWDGLAVLRPLLGSRRETLRAFLRDAGIGWIEDPSNRDRRFARVRVREALGALETLGLGVERLAETAGAMRRAREALEQATADLARAALTAGAAGDAVLDLAAIGEAPREIRLRLFAATLGWVSGAPYRPRLGSLERALEGLEVGAPGLGGTALDGLRIERAGTAAATLHGCLIRRRGAKLTVRREPARVAPPVSLAEGRWDGRWEWIGDSIEAAGVKSGADAGGNAREKAGAAAEETGLRIGALGAAGLAECGDWRARGLRREALLSTPALWRGTRLVAAPLARPEPGARFRRISALPSPWELTL